jgi:hypothetical protein
MNDIISRTLQGRARAAAWDAIAQASQAETRATKPESARRLLDALDKRFRAEKRDA